MNLTDAGADTSTNGPRVLVVVRDHGLRDSVEAALAGEGYLVVTTEHGADALTYLKQWQPRVALVDMRLPTTDAGASLRSYRRAAGSSVAIIGLSAFAIPDVALEAAQMESIACLAMPLDVIALRALVRRHAGQEKQTSLTFVDGTGAARRGPAAVVEALRAFAAQPDRRTPWMRAADLAQCVGAPDVHDPQFVAVVQALYGEGTVRLMAGGSASGGNFYEAMLVPAA